MILDSHNLAMSTAKTSTSLPPPLGNPPAYSDVDYVPVPSSSSERQHIGPNTWVVKPPEITSQPTPIAIGPTTVYHYVHPVTQERLASLLPPTHPEMVCLQEGGHVLHTKFGLLGILAAIFWFPLGIGLCILDRRVKCTRCGLTIDEGLCA